MNKIAKSIIQTVLALIAIVVLIKTMFVIIEKILPTSQDEYVEIYRDKPIE